MQRVGTTYRQRTSASLEKGLGNDPTADQISYESLLTGWKDYLADDNHGRPVIFIGHSQGAANLIRLLRGAGGRRSPLRARLVSAVVLGGDVEVPVGKTVGGTFAHIPACTKASQTGCVIAYSSFSSAPPADALFGRPGRGLSLQSGQKAARGQEVVCTNPAALGEAGAAPLTPYFVSSTSTTGALGHLPRALYGHVRELGWRQLAPDRRSPGRRPSRRHAHARTHVGPPPRRRQSGARRSGRGRDGRGVGLRGAPPDTLTSPFGLSGTQPEGFAPVLLRSDLSRKRVIRSETAGFTRKSSHTYFASVGSVHASNTDSDTMAMTRTTRTLAARSSWTYRAPSTRRWWPAA